VSEIELALNEDIGSGDVSVALFPENTQIKAQVKCREKCVIFGKYYFEQSFKQLDSSIKITWLIDEAKWLEKNTVLCEIQGSQKALLTAERTALNFLQLLSSTATQTRILVDKIASTSCKILDTRKTIPNLRHAQKQAVLAGGGVNHRIGLFDCILIKENHISVLGNITNAVNLAKEKYPKLPLIVEVETLEQLKEALALPIDRILCDNFDLAQLKKSVALANKKIPLEASGNISKSNILKIAQTGIDFVSIGSITKNIQAIDLSLTIMAL
jgi:nicotinate-nucleotide pyrophosphorylase (carboxylating)